MYSSETKEETILANVGALGQVNMLKLLSELDYEKFSEVLNDE